MNTKKNETVNEQSPTGLAYLLGRTHHAMTRRMRDVLAEVGLSVAQYTALSFLKRESLSNAQLAERAMISPQAANEMVKAMTARGWMTRDPDPTHGRIIRIGLTAEGEAMLDAGNRCVSTIESQMLSACSADRAAALREDLRAMLRVLLAPDV